MAITTFTSSQITILDNALNPATTTSQKSPPVVSANNVNALSTNADENPVKGGPTNTPIAASGNGYSSATAIKRSNNKLKHACDSSTYVGAAAAQLGAWAGQLMSTIREGIKSALQAMGVDPSSSSIASKIKKVAQWIKDKTTLINKITKFLTKFLALTNLIRQAIAFILTLPARLLKYFADCVTTLKKQLVASYKQALGDTSIGGDFKEIQDAIKDVQKSVGDFTKSVTKLAATTAAVTSSVQMTAAAAKAVFDGAGFSSKSKKFTKA